MSSFLRSYLTVAAFFAGAAFLFVARMSPAGSFLRPARSQAQKYFAYERREGDPTPKAGEG